MDWGQVSNWSAALTAIIGLGTVVFWSHRKLGQRLDKQETRLDQLYVTIISLQKDFHEEIRDLIGRKKKDRKV